MTMLSLLATGLMHAPPMDGHSVNLISLSAHSDYRLVPHWIAELTLTQAKSTPEFSDSTIFEFSDLSGQSITFSRIAPYSKPDHNATYGYLEQAQQDESERSLISNTSPDVTATEAREYYMSGHDLLEQGNLTAAIAAFQQALQLDPSQASYYNCLGTALRRQGRLDEAAEAYQQALQLDDQHPEIYANLATVLLSQGHQQEAIAALYEARALLYQQAREEEAHQLEMVIHQLEGGDSPN
jgi:tetratricopeptide (TPR) repeat protein